MQNKIQINIIDGNKLAKEVLSILKKKKTPTKELSAIIVGNDKASESFIKKKANVAKELGVKFTIYKLPTSLSQTNLEKKVLEINNEKNVGGVIVQLPLPKKYKKESALAQISIEKDVDAISGNKPIVEPPAVSALSHILKKIKFTLTNKNIVIVGSGFLIGLPIEKWLSTKKCKIKIINKGEFTPKCLKTADLVITGTGVPDLIKGKYLKNNAVVIDYGYSRKDGKLSGDIETKSVQKVAKFFTPTPGGTGPMVVAKLFENFYKLAKK